MKQSTRWLPAYAGPRLSLEGVAVPGPVEV